MSLLTSLFGKQRPRNPLELAQGQRGDLARAGIDVTKNEMMAYFVTRGNSYAAIINNSKVVADSHTGQIVGIERQQYEIGMRVSAAEMWLDELDPLGEGGSKQEHFIELMMYKEILMMYWDWVYQLTNSREFRDLQELGDEEARELVEEVESFGEVEILRYLKMIIHAVWKEKHVVPQYANVFVNPPNSGLGSLMGGGELNPVIENARREASDMAE